jgi:pimeloyl-ACP methyl ester carboxylesterase
MIKYGQKIIILSVYFLYTASACVADTSPEHDKKVRVLYEQAFELYEKIELEYRTVQVNEITMSYLDFGSKDGVPLIWAHGSNWTGYEILNVKDGLLGAGYRVIAIDYRGHGKTQITDFKTSLYDVADDIAGLLDHLHISAAVIGGWSKGGFIATAFYDEYPERTLGLLLEDGGSWSVQKMEDERPYTEAEQKARRTRVEKHQNADYSSRFDMFRSQVSASVDLFSIEMAANLISHQHLKENGKWGYHVDRNLIHGDLSGVELKLPSRLPLMQWDQQAVIPKIIFRNLDVPIHILDPVIENDTIPVSHQNRDLKNHHPDLIEHEIYENTGHAVHLARPDRFIESAKALLTRVNKRL